MTTTRIYYLHVEGIPVSQHRSAAGTHVFCFTGDGAESDHRVCAAILELAEELIPFFSDSPGTYSCTAYTDNDVHVPVFARHDCVDARYIRYQGPRT